MKMTLNDYIIVWGSYIYIYIYILIVFDSSRLVQGYLELSQFEWDELLCSASFSGVLYMVLGDLACR